MAYIINTKKLKPDQLDVLGLIVDVTIRRLVRTFGGAYEATARIAQDHDSKTFSEDAMAILLARQWHWEITANTRSGAEMSIYALVALALFDAKAVGYTAVTQQDEGSLRFVTLPVHEDDGDHFIFKQVIEQLPAFGARQNVLRVTTYKEADGVHFDRLDYLEIWDRQSYALAAAYIVHLMRMAEKDKQTAVVFEEV